VLRTLNHTPLRVLATVSQKGVIISQGSVATQLSILVIADSDGESILIIVRRLAKLPAGVWWYLFWFRMTSDRFFCSTLYCT